MHGGRYESEVQKEDWHAPSYMVCIFKVLFLSFMPASAAERQTPGLQPWDSRTQRQPVALRNVNNFEIAPSRPRAHPRRPVDGIPAREPRRRPSAAPLVDASSASRKRVEKNAEAQATVSGTFPPASLAVTTPFEVYFRVSFRMPFAVSMGVPVGVVDDVSVGVRRSAGLGGTIVVSANEVRERN